MIYKNFFKRKLDILFSLLFISFSFWIFILTYLYIYFINKGQVFFFQKRIGKNFKNFTILKFRTFQNKKIIFSGTFLRKYKIDEIPQFINILKGDMSLIGPRPLRPKHKREILLNCSKERFKTLPGLIGPSQIMFKSWQPDPKLYFNTDLDYINNISFKTDLKIFILFIKNFLKFK